MAHTMPRGVKSYTEVSHVDLHINSLLADRTEPHAQTFIQNTLMS